MNQSMNKIINVIKKIKYRPREIYVILGKIKKKYYLNY